MSFLQKSAALGILLCCALLVHAEEAAQPETSDAPPLPIRYFEITPNIMTFYQSSGRKIGYVVVQVQVVVHGDENLELVENNLPLIQDALTDFFNRQTKAVIQDLKQRESLLKQAKAKVASVLKAEIGHDVVDDLLFTQYIYQ